MAYQYECINICFSSKGFSCSFSISMRVRKDLKTVQCLKIESLRGLFGFVRNQQRWRIRTQCCRISKISNEVGRIDNFRALARI